MKGCLVSQTMQRLPLQRKASVFPMLTVFVSLPMEFNFAVMSYNNAKKIRIYYSCGKLMKEVDLSKHGFQAATDCAFTDHSLYVADHNGKKCTNCRQLGNLFEFFLLVDTFFKLQHVKTGFTSPQIVVGKMSMCTIPTVN